MCICTCIGDRGGSGFRGGGRGGGDRGGRGRGGRGRGGMGNSSAFRKLCPGGCVSHLSVASHCRCPLRPTTHASSRSPTLFSCLTCAPFVWLSCVLSVCRNWSEKGTCKFGADCKFEHPEGEKGTGGQVRMYVCIHVHVYTCVCAGARVHACVHACVCVRACAFACAFVCACACVRARVRVVARLLARSPPPPFSLSSFPSLTRTRCTSLARALSANICRRMHGIPRNKKHYNVNNFSNYFLLCIW